jgi:hypothetical protein
MHRAMCVCLLSALVIKLKNAKQRRAHCVCDEFISQHMHARTKRESREDALVACRVCDPITAAKQTTRVTPE